MPLNLKEKPMPRCQSFVLLGIALAAWPMAGRAGDDGRALVLEAMKAHGGQETLNKHRALQGKHRGTLESMGATFKIEGEIFLDYPDRMKQVATLEVANNTIQLVQVFDRKTFWMSVNGMNLEMKDKDVVTETKERLYAEWVGNLVGLDGKDFKLAPLGEMKIKDQDAIGLRVSKEGCRDVNLWLDKKTHLLVKSEFRGKEPPLFQGAEINQEKYILGYKKVMGIMTPTRFEVHYDGKKALELEITDIRFHERLDDSYFAKP